MQRTNRRRTRNTVLADEIKRLNQLVDAYRTSRSTFGTLTRQALDIEILPSIDTSTLALVYFDIDRLRYLNEEYGKAERKQPDQPSVNERIAAAFALMRAEDVIIGQWFSGDEFIALVPDQDVLGFTDRLQAQLRANGVTATFLIVTIWQDRPLEESIHAADNSVSGLKRLNLRDSIHDWRSSE